MTLQQHFLDLEETITAQASAIGESLRGIIRITGPGTANLVNKLISLTDLCEWHTAKTPYKYDGLIVSSKLRNQLPVSVYWWPTCKSYTGQPLAELHLTGSPPLINLALGEIYTLGARPATPGEFTLRAFLNGKLDLLQAEAVLGVIDARTDVELQQALSQLAGGISHQFKELRSELLNDLADLEAGLDFVDEDLDFISRDSFSQRLELGIKLAQELRQITTQRMTSQAYPKVVLAGLPNAGKSTLFNLLLEKSAAIVSPVKGTTRDYLSAIINIQGMKVELIDTAGIDESTAGADQTGQNLRQRQFQHADIILWCQASDFDQHEISDSQQHLMQLYVGDDQLIKVQTKVDLAPIQTPVDLVGITTCEQTGIDVLKTKIYQKLCSQYNDHAILISSTAARCQEALHKTEEALSQARLLLAHGLGDEMIALEIRSALESLGEITGEVFTNDLLDRIFSRFCIGK